MVDRNYMLSHYLPLPSLLIKLIALSIWISYIMILPILRVFIYVIYMPADDPQCKLLTYTEYQLL